MLKCLLAIFIWVWKFLFFFITEIGPPGDEQVTFHFICTVHFLICVIKHPQKMKSQGIFSLRHCVQTESGAYPFSYAGDKEGGT
jgi:hypothetical protein